MEEACQLLNCTSLFVSDVLCMCLSVCLLNCVVLYVGIGREIELRCVMNSYVLSNSHQILFGLTNGEGEVGGA